MVDYPFRGRSEWRDHPRHSELETGEFECHVPIVMRSGRIPDVLLDATSAFRCAGAPEGAFWTIDGQIMDLSDSILTALVDWSRRRSRPRDASA